MMKKDKDMSTPQSNLSRAVSRNFPSIILSRMNSPISLPILTDSPSPVPERGNETKLSSSREKFIINSPFLKPEKKLEKPTALKLVASSMILPEPMPFLSLTEETENESPSRKKLAKLNSYIYQQKIRVGIYIKPSAIDEYSLGAKKAQSLMSLELSPRFGDISIPKTTNNINKSKNSLARSLPGTIQTLPNEDISKSSHRVLKLKKRTLQPDPMNQTKTKNSEHEIEFKKLYNKCLTLSNSITQLDKKIEKKSNNLKSTYSGLGEKLTRIKNSAFRAEDLIFDDF